MSDHCSICGRYYAVYSEGHTPHSKVCLENQHADLLARVKELESELDDWKLVAKENAKKLDDDFFKRQELKSQLHQRDTALVECRKALLSVPPHRTIHGEAKAQTWSDALALIDSTLHQTKDAKL